MKPNAPSVIKRSLFWKEHVARATRDPAQRARALASVERLKEELRLAEQSASATEHEPIATNPERTTK